MAHTARADSVNLVALNPVLDGNGDLVDININFTVRYIDDNAVEVAVVSRSIASFELLTSEQITAITALRAGMRDAIEAMFLDV